MVTFEVSNYSIHEFWQVGHTFFLHAYVSVFVQRLKANDTLQSEGYPPDIPSPNFVSQISPTSTSTGQSIVRPAMAALELMLWWFMVPKGER